MKTIFAIATLLLCSPTLFGGVIAADKMEDESGSTRSKGSYKIEDDGKNIKVSVRFNVKKTGVTGTGKGVIAFQILNDSWDSVFHMKKGLTVGANAFKGVKDKDWKRTVTLTGPRAEKVRKEGLAIAFIVDTERDDIGIPQSLDEWKKAIKDVVDVAKVVGDLAPGKSAVNNGWKFLKIK